MSETREPRQPEDNRPAEDEGGIISTEPEWVSRTWLRNSLLGGFVATFVLTVVVTAGYGVANTFGEDDGPLIQQWFYNLVDNPLVDEIADRFVVGMFLNLISGLVFAVIYGRFAEPYLRGPGWQRGAIFSLLPWLLSITVFFLVMGIGIFGLDIDAGPLPVLGNLIAHLAYGVVLGAMYSIEESEARYGAPEEQRKATAGSGRGAIIGLLIGAILGLGGGWLVSGGMEELASPAVIALAGALTVGAMGTLIGSFMGLGYADPERDQ